MLLLMKGTFLLRVYLIGHSGRILPRRLRKLIARSEIHRAWLLGYMGFFEQGGVSFGPAHPYRIDIDFRGAAFE